LYDVKTPYDPGTFRPQDSVGRLIGLVRKAILEKTAAQLAPLEISAAQWIVILLLAELPSITPAELCRKMDYDPGAMTRLIARLEHKGFVRRVPLADDRRSVGLELMPEGRALYPAIVQALASVHNQMLRGFGRAELQGLEGYLRRILAKVGANA
jgi:DNA-binding MarR family transcriptional regulator